MAMPPRNPFDDIEEFFERMSQQFEGTADWPVPWKDTPVDVAEYPEKFVVTIDVPGYRKDDIDLTLSEGTLRISADRTTEVEDARYIRRERRGKSISRTVSLPEAVEEDEVGATLADGVLSVTLPKKAAGESSTSIDIE